MLELYTQRLKSWTLCVILCHNFNSFSAVFQDYLVLNVKTENYRAYTNSIKTILMHVSNFNTQRTYLRGFDRTPAYANLIGLRVERTNRLPILNYIFRIQILGYHFTEQIIKYVNWTSHKVWRNVDMHCLNNWHSMMFFIRKNVTQVCVHFPH